MIHFLVGHRGAGKSSLLKRLEKYCLEEVVKQDKASVTEQNFIFEDLDGEIEKSVGKSVSEIFAFDGEKRFRELEQKVLSERIEKNASKSVQVYSLGAGYQGEFPEGVRVHWVKRSTDKQGRIFLDRPSLTSSESGLEEWEKIYSERESKYAYQSQTIFEMDEGFDFPNEEEKVLWKILSGENQLFGNQKLRVGAEGFPHITILPHHLEKKDFLESLWESFANQGFGKIELRDDLLNLDQLHQVLRSIPHEHILFSHRSSLVVLDDLGLSKGTSFRGQIEVAAELLEDGLPQDLKIDFVSFHETSPMEFANRADLPLKWSPIIETFDELIMGHHWWLQDPRKRSFLPRSSSGRWQWYRCLFGAQQFVSFVRYGEGSSVDQPTVLEWMKYVRPQNNGFAAILGSPVNHSLTPAFHYEFFDSRSMPVLRIDLKEEEFNPKSLDFLKSLGLKAAAVTSPLKKRLFELVSSRSTEAENFTSANTLCLLGGKWHLEFTDSKGLQESISRIGQSLETSVPELVAMKTAVWGGGGLLNLLKETFKDAHFYSARTGELRSEIESAAVNEEFQPELVVWSVSRGRMDNCNMPPQTWKPKIVFDLNYSEDSPGKDYAKKIGARYISGLKFFEAQARLQLKIWSEVLKT